MIVSVNGQRPMFMSPTLNLIVTLYIFQEGPCVGWDVAQWIKDFLVNRV